MADDKSTDKDEIFLADEWPINDTTTLRVSLRQFKGNRYIDIRRRLAQLVGGSKPGKGASVRPDDIRRLRKALKAIERWLTEQRKK